MKPKEEVKTPESGLTQEAVREEHVPVTGQKHREKKKTQDAYRILLRPLISEKAAHFSGMGQYAFIVKKDVNKIQIKQAVEAVYDVHVHGVNTSVVRGKIVRSGRHQGKRGDWKKAIVTLSKGEKIDLYSGV